MKYKLEYVYQDDEIVDVTEYNIYTTASDIDKAKQNFLHRQLPVYFTGIGFDCILPIKEENNEDEDYEIVPEVEDEYSMQKAYNKKYIEDGEDREEFYTNEELNQMYHSSLLDAVNMEAH